MTTFQKNLLLHNRTIFHWLIGLDLSILALHLFFGTHNHFFHLDFEQNLPTIYQSFKLTIFGFIFFVLGLKKSTNWNIKGFILPLSLVLIFLGFDEFFQIHENIYRIFELFDLFHPSKIIEASMKMGYRSSLWILYYVPFIIMFAFWSGYWLHYLQSKMKSNAWILIISSLSLLGVLLAEILSSTGSFSESIYFWLVTLEETAEMLLASTLVLVGSKMISWS